MPEQISNVEIAHKIHEQGHTHSPMAERRFMWIEIAEAIALAVVAVATAWSGYQATKWDALSNQNYSRSSSVTVMAQEKATLAGQDRLYDIVTFNGWVAATASGNKQLSALYEHRFRPEYAVAFLAWQKMDPLHNVSAPPGPIFMPQYTNANAQQSLNLAREAQSYFEKGVSTRETGDHYVKVSVFLATVLLLTALGQRFRTAGPRIFVLSAAFVLLIISTFWIFNFPRA
jgi:hypothetical protein